jgi:fructose 1,6-bisphosphatase
MNTVKKIFAGLRTASLKQIFKAQGKHWKKRGGLPRKTRRESNVIASGLTYDEAVAFLDRVQKRLMASGDLHAAFMYPFLVGWWAGVEKGILVPSFPVQLWMVKRNGAWSIVDRSLLLFQFPYLCGAGWVEK